MAVQENGSPRAAIGYHSPDVKMYAPNDDILRRLMANDPEVAGLTVRGYDVSRMNDGWGEKIGHAIGKSTHLRKLIIVGSLAYATNQQHFFTWLAHNRSIEDFQLFTFDFTGLDFDMIQILAPFFTLNTSLRSIIITRSKNLREGIPSLMALISMEGNRLERINLIRNQIGDMQAAALINGLNALPGLRNLLEFDLRSNEIGKEGCVALGSLLKNPECNLQVLHIPENCLNDECINILVCGLVKCKTLKMLGLSLDTNMVTDTGWQIFFIFLSSPMCLLEKLILRGDFGDENVVSLGDSLAINQVMKSLSMFCIDISSSVCRQFAKCLRSPLSALMELDLPECVRTDEVAVAIFEALANNTTLKKLVLTNNDSISSTAWTTCFQLLVGSQSALEELHLDSCEIDDEGANVLVTLLSRQLCTVRLLDIRYNYLITADGWRAFVDVLLPNSSSRLETLRIGCHPEIEDAIRMNDDAVLDFISALSSNTSLVELNIGDIDIAPGSLDALSKVLCDKSSISSVYASNHTLNIFKYTCNDDVEDNQCRIEQLDSLLKLNKNKDKAEVVREKILMSSVLKKDTVGIAFGCMPVTVFPSVIEWIGRDRLGFSAMYCLTQNYPSLLEHLSQPGAGCEQLLESPRKLQKVV